ncbi:acetylornithine deacetylase [Aaosphaeria arxii CBS 175.79]|uniref:Probable succinyl-diaminopimelate desuccinylase n=1 Tax=Aaosphaeria arxii CBS 175.79 TaxID=1450172 RepID=A0A6A5Y1U1_9PLEO|nr:acetylornithine deacetylase [Aaosphaeria arxii CBS 175.79]KAF2019462.1 acetylornithine deacetylase [Aaosphaeria arxii CBS 175.79]
MSSLARKPLFRPHVESWHSTPTKSVDDAFRFHQSLPDYKPTPLVSLASVAKEIGVRAVYIKDESSRFGLPSFKVLGASWGTYRALAEKLNLPVDADLDTVRQAASTQGIKLYAATDGNHGRAVAWMGKLLGLPSVIMVPAGMHQSTISLIESEGADVIVSHGDYDQAVQEAYTAANSEGGILIQDFAFGDYQEVAQWIVDGYQTMMQETQDQLQGDKADLVIVPAGVGSFAQSAVSHFRQPGSSTKVLTVEPDTAACLRKSFESGKLTAISTTPTIMAGLDCGTPSSISWPMLREGVWGSITVSDFEAHVATDDIQSFGVSAGPCGGSTLAALRRLCSSDKTKLGLDHNSVVVLPCTEGMREYTLPLDVAIDDPIKLTQQLVQINSANPGMGSIPGPGETELARYIAAWLEHRDIEAHWVEPTKGRPSIVGVSRGTGKGKSLMFNGHIDTVTLGGYEGDPLSGEIKDGKIYGRGAADMKCGIAASMVALAKSKQLRLAGDVIFAGVADEENLSIGTEDILKAGWRADAAIVCEPTNLSLVNTHKGFVWLEVDIHGVAAHGSRADLGIDAITKAGHFLVALDRHSDELRKSRDDSSVGPPTIHASMIKGGEEASSYPAICTLTIERRTLPGETSTLVEQELRNILDKIKGSVKDFNFDIRVTFERPSFELPRDHPFCNMVSNILGQSSGEKKEFEAVPYWTDCALLAEKGISTLLWGPVGDGLHGKEEWAGAESVNVVTAGLTSIAEEFCK